MTKHAFLVAIDDHLTMQTPEQVAAECDAHVAAAIGGSTGVAPQGAHALTYRDVAILVTDEPAWRVVWGGGDVIEALEPYDA